MKLKNQVSQVSEYVGGLVEGLMENKANSDQPSLSLAKAISYRNNDGFASLSKLSLVKLYGSICYCVIKHTTIQQ